MRPTASAPGLSARIAPHSDPIRTRCVSAARLPWQVSVPERATLQWHLLPRPKRRRDSGRHGGPRRAGRRGWKRRKAPSRPTCGVGGTDAGPTPMASAHPRSPGPGPRRRRHLRIEGGGGGGEKHGGGAAPESTPHSGRGGGPRASQAEGARAAQAPDRSLPQARGAHMVTPTRGSERAAPYREGLRAPTEGCNQYTRQEGARGLYDATKSGGCTIPL